MWKSPIHYTVVLEDQSKKIQVYKSTQKHNAFNEARKHAKWNVYSNVFVLWNYLGKSIACQVFPNGNWERL